MKNSAETPETKVTVTNHTSYAVYLPGTPQLCVHSQGSVSTTAGRVEAARAYRHTRKLLDRGLLSVGPAKPKAKKRRAKPSVTKAAEPEDSQEDPQKAESLPAEPSYASSVPSGYGED